MAIVFLSLGSNIDREKNIQGCMDALNKHFCILGASVVYESEAVGFKGTNFFNSVVKVETALSIKTLSEQLRAIEHAHGRRRDVPKFSPRSLDIDILTYDDCIGEFGGVSLPRAEILYNAFVLRPLSDIAPDSLHPVAKKPYRTLWDEFSLGTQKLWPAVFHPTAQYSA